MSIISMGLLFHFQREKHSYIYAHCLKNIKQCSLCTRVSSNMLLSLYNSNDIHSKGDPATLFPEWSKDKSTVFEINRGDFWPMMGVPGFRVIIWC